MNTALVPTSLFEDQQQQAGRRGHQDGAEIGARAGRCRGPGGRPAPGRPAWPPGSRDNGNATANTGDLNNSGTIDGDAAATLGSLNNGVSVNDLGAKSITGTAHAGSSLTNWGGIGNGASSGAGADLTNQLGGTITGTVQAGGNLLDDGVINLNGTSWAGSATLNSVTAGGDITLFGNGTTTGVINITKTTTDALILAQGSLKLGDENLLAGSAGGIYLRGSSTGSLFIESGLSGSGNLKLLTGSMILDSGTGSGNMLVAAAAGNLANAGLIEKTGGSGQMNVVALAGNIILDNANAATQNSEIYATNNGAVTMAAHGSIFIQNGALVNFANTGNAVIEAARNLVVDKSYGSIIHSDAAIANGGVVSLSYASRPPADGLSSLIEKTAGAAESIFLVQGDSSAANGGISIVGAGAGYGIRAEILAASGDLGNVEFGGYPTLDQGGAVNFSNAGAVCFGCGNGSGTGTPSVNWTIDNGSSVYFSNGGAIALSAAKDVIVNHGSSIVFSNAGNASIEAGRDLTVDNGSSIGFANQGNSTVNAFRNLTVGSTGTGIIERTAARTGSGLFLVETTGTGGSAVVSNSGSKIIDSRTGNGNLTVDALSGGLTVAAGGAITENSSGILNVNVEGVLSLSDSGSEIAKIGVYNANDLISAGSIVNDSALSAATVRATAADISNTGTITGNVATAHGALTNTGSISGFAVSSDALINSGTIGGNANAGGSLSNNIGGMIAGNVQATQNLANYATMMGNATAIDGVLSNYAGGSIGGNATAVHGTFTNGGVVSGSAVSGADLSNDGTLSGGATSGRKFKQ